MAQNIMKENHSFLSSHLSKKVDIVVYGHYGFAVLLFPATGDNPNEYENEGFIEALLPFLNKGKFKVFSVTGIDNESWLNNKITPEERSKRHLEYNNFIIEECIPYIFGECGGPVPIITCGAATGAYHAANTYFRRPDIFYGTIAMSGFYNIEALAKGYFDTNCYFNSPVHYLPNLNDNYWLSFLKSKHHVYILSGRGEGEDPYNSVQLGDILASKGIPHLVDLWGPEWNHNWLTWNTMAPQIFENRF